MQTATAGTSGTHPGAEWPSDWLRAALGLCVLRALEEGPSYGYAIIAELERAGLGTIKGGTLYPLLTRHEASGWVTTEWKAGDGGPGRKYFALTDSGRDELHHQADRWNAFTAASIRYISPAGSGNKQGRTA